MATTTYRFRSSAHRGDASFGNVPRSYPLLLWFAVASAIAILFVLISVTTFLTRFVERTSLSYDANVLTQLVKSIVEVEDARGYFLEGEGGHAGDFVEFLAHLSKLPGVLRANVYGVDRKVLWSSDPTLVGKRFGENDELETAFAGEPVITSGTVGVETEKDEHTGIETPGGRFVENYLPVWSPTPGERRVIGVIEVYRTPASLLRTIHENQQRIWWGAIAVGVLLYLLLFVIVARAARIMARQQAALLAAERLAMAGEMASAVAHGLRNPLASIRSTAELGLESGPEGEVRELLCEVVTQTDRLEGWIRQFLTTARANPAHLAPADVQATVQDCLTQFQPTLARRDTSVALDLPDHLPRIRFCPVMLRQVLNSVLANASEAMAGGGALRVGAAADAGRVTIEIADTGPGMSAAEIEAALSPFATTKPAGLGLGLPLAREMLERHGGRLEIESRPGAGTKVRLSFEAAFADGRADT
jgi:signal transduction histidine kinase